MTCCDWKKCQQTRGVRRCHTFTDFFIIKKKDLKSVSLSKGTAVK